MTGMPIGTRGWRAPRAALRRAGAARGAELEGVEMSASDLAPPFADAHVGLAPRPWDERSVGAPVVDGAVGMAGVRLALVSDTYLPQLNGVTRTLDRLVQELRARGGAVEVFTTTDPAARPDDGVERLASVPFWGYPQLRLAAPETRRLASALARWGATLVHAATPFGVGLSGRAAARRCALPLVTSYHTHFTAYAHHYRLGILSEPGWRYLRWFHNAGRRTFCPTAAVARELEGHGFTNTAVWGRGVDSTVFSPAWRSLALRGELGLREAELVLLYVGRVAREKGLDDLIEAMHLLRALPDAPPCRLLIVGDGPDLERCRARAGETVTFLGRRTGRELSRLYASADLFVFPSTTDTFGNVTLEAMASGLPVIAADSPVNRELVVPGSGSWYRGGDASALASHVARWGRDPALRQAAARRGREAAGARSWERVFDALFAEYKGAVRRGREDGRTRAGVAGS
jgi:glycosyltransferase involved in cell wall biosynthesis